MWIVYLKIRVGIICLCWKWKVQNLRLGIIKVQNKNERHGEKKWEIYLLAL